jgi:hypothetical protein
MSPYQDLKDEAEKQVKDYIGDDSYSTWKKNKIVELLFSAMDMAYKQGRSDQQYIDKGPQRINIYK